ncbi:MAG TPA: chemotaxis protein CheA [Candidatus Binatia bacterium]|nr:chemotaxis protein CheA [Candidatus Binatia bacterium]
MTDNDGTEDIIREFLVESHENLDQLDRDLVQLEDDPTNREILARVFRTIHTIKGTCGFLGFERLERVAHVGESLLSRLRDGELLLETEMASGLLTMVDAVRTLLRNIEETGGEGDADYADVVELLTRLQSSGGASAPSEAGSAAPAASSDPETSHDGPSDAARVPAAQRSDAATNAEPRAAALPTAEGKGPAKPAPASTSAAPSASASAPAPPSDAPGGDGRAVSSLADSSIRVDVGLLDKLMNLAGELVLARNQILQFAATQQDASFLGTTQRLNLITTELQEGVMKTRMQPIKTIWSKFPRVVRDLAVTCHKQVRIDMEGEETELDRTILEAIKDPLTHIVRNSVDHGVESPEDRKAAGKPVEGRLLLRAFHEGGHVNIEITDDGKGIDPERVRAKALERGVVTNERIARMSDREILGLIFVPGFSTAEKVTNVSGRGVGMDVVKTNIEKIGGSVDIQSRPGEGTTLKIKIPLTLAIIPALVVTTGGERFAIPQVSLLELVRLEGEQARQGIEMIHGARVYRLRGNLLPLIDLNRELRLGQSETASDSVNIVILQADDRQFGLVVEAINDTEEIVVKPLSMQLKGIPTFAGATIMGDGKVALILDVLGLAQKAGVISEVRDRSLGEQVAGANAERAGDRQTLLLFSVGEGGRLAIPLSMVARLEEFPKGSVERSGRQEVVQYRGCIMPLIRLSSILGTEPCEAAAASDVMQVVVYSEQGRSVGLVVDQILDIVEETLAIRRDVSRGGVLGSVVIQDRVTDLLDVHGIIGSEDPSFFDRQAA